ncbi:uncharacterized protein BO80DRAFT_456372 [Aspergillus ibericus CBS 121593]|uniref:Uncharacterized protein n=1 Tax=Aspergillus ibericus CBS 121593 TaxID=1448316 RepID=A0A395GWD2_9EURO|nr:hypothetical protein BO80DRAFT_456372 [Aspergillus ibericus CBS 121593]RAK99669.1 hypothetical protein BO80DRAFT_456372 [Aspergillus ibericus CBS 121593]
MILSSSARCPLYYNIGYSSDNDGIDSSISFRLDLDNAVGVDFPIDTTDVITPTCLYGEWVEIGVDPVGTALGNGLREESLTGVRKDLLLQAA